MTLQSLEHLCEQTQAYEVDCKEYGGTSLNHARNCADSAVAALSSLRLLLSQHKRMRELLEDVKCPNCDGSARIESQVSGGGVRFAVTHMCKWCAERDAIRKELSDEN